nr:hypothetical protein [uncultured bacterium]
MRRDAKRIRAAPGKLPCIDWTEKENHNGIIGKNLPDLTARSNASRLRR